MTLNLVQSEDTVSGRPRQLRLGETHVSKYRGSPGHSGRSGAAAMQTQGRRAEAESGVFAQRLGSCEQASSSAAGPGIMILGLGECRGHCHCHCHCRLPSTMMSLPNRGRAMPICRTKPNRVLSSTAGVIAGAPEPLPATEGRRLILLESIFDRRHATTGEQAAERSVAALRVAANALHANSVQAARGADVDYDVDHSPRANKRASPCARLLRTMAFCCG